MKPVITTYQKQKVDFPFIFSHQSPLFQAPLDRLIFNAPYSCKFPGPSRSIWTASYTGSISYYEKFQYAKTHNQVFINSIYNPGNAGRLNWIFLYLLDWSLQVISRQLQVFRDLSSHFNLSWITKLIILKLNLKSKLKQETLRVVTIAMICSTLVSLWRRPVYNPV